MNIWSKLLTALHGGINDAGEAVIDGQALRILDQEIRDADKALRRSKETLAGIMAKQKLAAERVRKTEKQIEEYENYALKALDTGNEALAHEVAGKIAALEAELVIDREQEAGFSASVAQLRKSVGQAEGNIKRLKQQVDTVKATESVQKAQMTVAERFDGSQSKLHTAVESLERIKRRQAERAAKMEVSAELAVAASVEDELDAKLKAAGIVADDSNADSVLQRLKNKTR